MFNDIPTTEKVLIQVQCQACGKSMSEKNLKYSHAAYCIKRVQDADNPKYVPVSKVIMKQMMKLKPVKTDQSDEVLYDGIDLLKEESNSNTIDLSVFNNMEIKRLDALKHHHIR